MIAFKNLTFNYKVSLKIVHTSKATSVLESRIDYQNIKKATKYLYYMHGLHEMCFHVCLCVFDRE